MRRECREPRRQRARPADQDPHDRRPQIVVGDARRHAIEMRKGAKVTIEKTDLILPLVDPSEVAVRVHEPHEEQRHALRRMPSTSTSTSKKSTPARSPGRYVSGTNPSRRCRFHSATASLTTVTPTRLPSA